MAKKTCIPVKPWCPFCGQNVPPPKAPVQRKMNEFTMGECQCGAVYVCDETGHNIGSAMVECLVHASHDNWELAWDLIPEEDYLTDQIDNYDQVTHQVVETRNLDGRAVRGVLYFVRMNQEFAQASIQSGTGQQSEQEEALLRLPKEPIRDPKRTKKKASKKEVEELADSSDIDGLVDLLFDDAKTMRYLQRLLYDPEPDKRWFYAYVMGRVCARYASQKPGAVSDLLHRLFEACSDSAASHWGLIETVGSVIAGRPDLFGAFAAHILLYRNVPTTRVQTLWAMAEIAKVRPDIVRGTPFYSLFPMLGHPDPLTRGHAVLLFGLLKATEVQSQIEGLLQDGAMLTIYSEGRPEHTTVAALARQALERVAGV
ncbi:MAG: PBS lyase [Desulfobulbaceae bacterium]|nr:PBS lyase [Desulfobulbaceae bacterium]